MGDSFKARSKIKSGGKSYTIYRLSAVKDAGLPDPARLPYSIRILLENLLRHEDGVKVFRKDIEAVASWNPKDKPAQEIAFTPARVILQDFTGVPAVVDLAAMREQLAKMGGDPRKINPLEQADLVIDHSVQVDFFGTADSFKKNVEVEMRRNKERYQFLKWGQKAFKNFRVVPPGTGIVHQVNLEHLASVVMTRPLLNPPPRAGEDRGGGEILAYPDTLVGTDSHTTMINGIGVLGWGVGGIEAEAAMLGQPISMLIPQVVGFKLTGKMPDGATATDLVLTVTEMLRKKGVVGKFVEFFGDGLASLPLADRATISNMAPEYGATAGMFPVDDQTLEYLNLTGRSKEQIELVKTYYTEQGLFRTKSTAEPEYSDTLELDLKGIVPSLAGPKRPQDRVPLSEMKTSFAKSLAEFVKHQGKALDPKRDQNWLGEGGSPLMATVGEKHADTTPHTATLNMDRSKIRIGDGAVVVAAITSCTNTSNPAVMIGAGLLAKKAVERGIKIKPWVKTSLAPGSKVVIDYLKGTGLLPYLEKLQFHLVGYGCTTCIGNSGPLPKEIASAIEENDLIAVSVLSGNRNFEGRINPHVKANYLASPPLVVAYALAGSVTVDISKDPLGKDKDGRPVLLKEIWPSMGEIQAAMKKVDRKMFEKEYASVFEGDKDWKSLPVPKGDTFQWDAKSTYVKNPPFFTGMPKEPQAVTDIKNARVLVMVGDSVTTDHISPAGSIPEDSPAGKYLKQHGVEKKDFNSYGSRRGNHEIMMRGTFGNIRLRNQLAPGTEGAWTRYFPSPRPLPKEGEGKGEGGVMTIFDAAMKYAARKTPLIVLAGKEYGTGSSRDWAAKGPALLGIKAVIAESYERIHRSNLIGMGMLPLQFESGQNRGSLGLTGEEEIAIEGIASGLKPGAKLKCRAKGKDGEKSFSVLCRIDTPVELEYYKHGGILQYVLRQLMKE